MYVVITEDRHVDVDVELFTSLADAIAHAKLKAKNLTRFIDCYEEIDVKGWLFCAKFACGESDCVRVIEVDVI